MVAARRALTEGRLLISSYLVCLVGFNQLLALPFFITTLLITPTFHPACNEQTFMPPILLLTFDDFCIINT